MRNMPCFKFRVKKKSDASTIDGKLGFLNFRSLSNWISISVASLVFQLSCFFGADEGVEWKSWRDDKSVSKVFEEAGSSESNSLRHCGFHYRRLNVK